MNNERRKDLVYSRISETTQKSRGEIETMRQGEIFNLNNEIIKLIFLKN